jgi:uncharacterized tellurite resistance protein B-like protein
MIDALFRKLLAPRPERLPAADLPLALAVLMVRVARADHHYTGDEVARIDRVLAARFGLAAPEAARLRSRAEALEAEAPDTVRFTRALKDAVALEDRAGLVEALWAVALADGARGDEEDQLIRLIAPLLGLTDRDSALARQRAQRA